jgi:CDP-2,3-bis-(O-geranylgeranyl)-sn-glycerol synthase
MDTVTLITNLLLGSIYFILPAYVANSTPTLFGGGPPIDGGRLWKDGRPILGPGKTWRGLIVGIVFGTLFGFLLGFYIEQETYKSTFRAFMLSFGALLGDAIGSFIKRRSGLKRGESFLFMDQLGFIFVGTILVILFSPLTIEGVSFYLINQLISFDPATIVIYFFILIPLTFIVHITANLIWYALGKQENPL